MPFSFFFKEAMKSSLMVSLRLDKGRRTQTSHRNTRDRWGKSAMQYWPKPVLASLPTLKRKTLTKMHLN